MASNLFPSRLDAAEFIVALTSSDSKKALVAAAMSRKSLATVSDNYLSQIENLWAEANKEALKHLNLVLGNNPHKTIDQIMKRPDVQSAMRTPYEEAASQAEALLIEAWEASVVASVKLAKAEFKLVGSEWQGYELDTALRDALVSDLHANAKAMRTRYHEALKNADDRPAALKKVAKDVQTRAGFSLSTAVWSVAALIWDSAASRSGLNRMWVSRMDGSTCGHCKGLHGHVVGPGEPFPSGSLKTYRDQALFGPPLHPQCRCVSVFTKLKKTKKELQKTV